MGCSCTYIFHDEFYLLQQLMEKLQVYLNASSFSSTSIEMYILKSSDKVLEYFNFTL